MLPAIGGVAAVGQLSGVASGAQSLASAGIGLAEPATGTPSLAPGGAEGGTSAVAASGESVGATEGIAGAGPAGEGGGFSEALTSAVSSLEKTQQDASGAAQALATGTAGDPESAVITVEQAQLAMQLASQIRTKATETIQGIFQTQV